MRRMSERRVQEEAEEASQKSVILDGSPKSARRSEPPYAAFGELQLQRLASLGGPQVPSSHLVPLSLDGALHERSTHGALPSEMVMVRPRTACMLCGAHCCGCCNRVLLGAPAACVCAALRL